MDILQPLPAENWTTLRDMMRYDWPKNIYYYNWIHNAIKWKKKDPNSKINIYCPNGTYVSGIFVGISSATVHLTVIFFLERSIDLLKKVLLETNVIDWNHKILEFGGIPINCSDDLAMALNKNDIKFQPKLASAYFRPRKECLNIKYEVPDDCRLGYLDESHIELIHSTWRHKSKKYPELTTGTIRICVTANKGIGLFLKKDDTLVSWVLENEWGGLGMLYTVEEHRRKGYGKIVTSAMMKEMAEKEYIDSVVFIDDYNSASAKLFKSLGFTEISNNLWVVVER